MDRRVDGQMNEDARFAVREMRRRHEGDWAGGGLTCQPHFHTNFLTPNKKKKEHKKEEQFFNAANVDQTTGRGGVRQGDVSRQALGLITQLRGGARC